MRPDKPKIRSPKIALQQELKEKQQEISDSGSSEVTADVITPAARIKA